MIQGKQVLPLVLIAGGLLLFADSKVSAASGSQFPPMIQALVDHFKLDPSEVKTVLDQEKQTLQSDRQKQFEDHLTALVNEGKITATQKDAILAKFSEIKQKMADIRNSSASKEDKRAEIKKLMDDLKSWAKDNNINLGVTRPWFGHGHGGPFGGVRNSGV